MPSYPPVGIRISYKGFCIINLPSHLDHWQLTLYLRQGYKSLSLTFYLSLTLQWGWCLTTQAETLFYHMVYLCLWWWWWGSLSHVHCPSAVLQLRAGTTGRCCAAHRALVSWSPHCVHSRHRGHCSCCSSSPLQYFLHRYRALIIINFFKVSIKLIALLDVWQSFWNINICINKINYYVKYNKNHWSPPKNNACI